MKHTMQDVARRAGVSKATVSYVLNGREATMRIPDETRQRILVAVRELDYRPNAVARSLAHQRTGTIAIVMQYPAVFSGWSGFTNELMHGVTDAAIRLGYDVLLCTKQPNEGWESEGADAVVAEVRHLTDGRVDGALLLRDREDPLAGALRQRNFPAVLMFTHSPEPEQWFVECDNARGAMLATEHLLSLGHRRIVHLAGSLCSAAGLDRRQGYQQALQQTGIEPNPAWTVELTYAGADFRPAISLFAAPAAQRPTAIFAWSDDVAIQMMRLLREAGLRVPEDVAIVGYDSTAVCDHTDPPLTSVRQPIYQMATQALELLVKRIGDDTPEQTHLWAQPELTIRQSCGVHL